MTDRGRGDARADPPAPAAGEATPAEPAEEPDADAAPAPEPVEDPQTRRRRETAEREAAERARLDREQLARAAARRATLDDARRLQDEEAARAKEERAERWRNEQAEIAAAAAEQAAERKRARQAERKTAAARKAARRAAGKTSRQAGRTENPGPGPRTENPGSVRTSPSPEEIAALAVASGGSTAPSAGTPSAAPGARPAVSPARDPRSYRERYEEATDPAARPGRQVLRPRSASRRVLSLLLLVALAATGGFGYAAWGEPTTATVGIVAACAGLTLVIWAVRATTAPVRVVLDHGILEVVSRRARHRFDLSTTHTPVEMVGQPGRRDWEIRIGRGAEAPLVLTAASVDSKRFTEMLRPWRPDL